MKLSKMIDGVSPDVDGKYSREDILTVARAVTQLKICADFQPQPIVIMSESAVKNIGRVSYLAAEMSQSADHARAAVSKVKKSKSKKSSTSSSPSTSVKTDFEESSVDGDLLVEKEYSSVDTGKDLPELDGFDFEF